jgi:hypothetical protein
LKLLRAQKRGSIASTYDLYMHEMIGKKPRAHRWRDNSCRSPNRPMSALGHKRTSPYAHPMSALPPKADMCSAQAHVCFGPIADIEGLREHFQTNAGVRGKTILISVNSPTGSAPTAKTIGIVVVAALAANAAGVLPRTAITHATWGAYGPGDVALRNPTTGAGCCARTPSGHTATPQRSVMNSRRLIAALKSRQSIVAVQMRLVKGTTRCPLWVKSRHDRQVRMTSALPPQLTLWPRKPMSALCQ